MRIDSPKIIAAECILLLRSDGTEVTVEAKIGEPYQISSDSWACPAALEGVDGRYPDIEGASSLQALSLALKLIATRLGHMLEDNGQLMYPEDRSPWDLSTFLGIHSPK